MVGMREGRRKTEERQRDHSDIYEDDRTEEGSRTRRERMKDGGKEVRMQGRWDNKETSKRGKREG